MEAGFLIIIMILSAAVYIAHVRVQRLTGKIDKAIEWAINNDEGYEDCADSIQAWGTKVSKATSEVAEVTQTMRMHSAQLKGGGERIRKLEANAASMDLTLAGLLQREHNKNTAEEPTLPGDLTPVQLTKPLAPNLGNERRIAKLRTEILGGTDPDGLPITGVLADLRQQVEGINANLGNKVGSFSKRVGDLESSQVPVARAAVRKILASQPRGLKRVWRWMTGTPGS